MTPLSDIRREYLGDPLDEVHSYSDPLRQFSIWFEQIRTLEQDPTAMALATATADERAPTTGRRSLAGRLLVATEALRDPRFARTVIYMVRHTEGGALGLVVNIPMGDAPFERALEPFGLEAPPGSGKVRVYYGGPVESHVLWTLAWMAGLLAVFVPLALRAYRRRA